jgi:hypothetical protein
VHSRANQGFFPQPLKKLSPAISVDANLPETGERLVRLYSAWESRTKPANGGGIWDPPLNSPSPSLIRFFSPFSCALWVAFNFPGPTQNYFEKS